MRNRWKWLFLSVLACAPLWTTPSIAQSQRPWEREAMASVDVRSHRDEHFSRDGWRTRRGGRPDLLAVLDSDFDHELSAEEIASASERLMSLDTNQDQRISRDEWNVAEFPSLDHRRHDHDWHPQWQSDGPSDGIMPHQFVDSIMAADANGDGELDFDELSSDLAPLSTYIDEDQSGGIDRYEAEQLFHLVFGLPNSQELHSAMLSEGTAVEESIEQIRSMLDAQQAAEAQNQNQIHREQRAQAFLYYFTVGAMLLSVMGFGHLISNPPKKQTGWRDICDDPSARRCVILSVAFIAGLSGIDLFWTMLSSESSHFSELNPLGVALLGDSSIAVFKLLTLSVTVMVFLALRRFRGAQIGSWWMCLVCTLVTWRWLITKSMFID